MTTRLPPQPALNVNRYTVDMLARDPGMHLFSFWFTVSTFTPTILACIGPLANMISIAAIVDPWRQNIDSDVVIRDAGWVLAINIVSLISGFAGNILLVLNFTGKIRYTTAQVSSIIMWLMASVILCVDLILVWKRDYFKGYIHSGGFYFGCFTCAIYFLCFLLLLINYVGYLLKEYDATFNLDESQRGLMIHTVMMGIWLVVGAGAFSKLIGLNYSQSMYFCTITILTIGLGDLVPKTNVARSLSLAYTFFGVLELGLIIAWLRQFVLSNIGPTLFWHRLEKSRKRLLKLLTEKDIVLDGPQSFEAITRLRTQCELRQRISGLFYTLASYVVFWLMGALVFNKVEGWSYFEATYFCFLCLLTTGYGDYAPKTSIGRSFFVIWALAAIPMMTLLISSVGDALFSIATHIDDFLSGITGLTKLYSDEKKFKRNRRPTALQALTALSSLVGTESHNASHEEAIIDDGPQLDMSPKEYRRESVKMVKRLLLTMNETPDKTHNFDEWAEVYYLVGEDPHKDMLFLEDNSPLRYPLKEGNFMMYKVLEDLEKRTEIESSQASDNDNDDDNDNENDNVNFISLDTDNDNNDTKLGYSNNSVEIEGVN